MRNKRIVLLITLLLLVVLGLAACGSNDEGDNGNSNENDSGNPSGTYSTLDVTSAHAQYSDEDDAIIVDVREPNEWTATGVPEGATLISLATITSVQSGAVDGLPKDKPIYVICNSGNRSRVAAERLVNLGYGPVFNIDGGIQAWLQADLPTEAYTG